MAQSIPFTLALARQDDFAPCKEVFYDSPLYTHYFADDDRLDNILHEAIEKGWLWCARHGEEIIGVMEMRPTGFFEAFPYLALLGVKKGWRGKGVGHGLLLAFEEAARQMGYGKAAIMVSHFNPRAKKLYLSLGYKKVGYLPSPFKPCVDENLLLKDL